MSTCICVCSRCVCVCTAYCMCVRWSLLWLCVILIELCLSELTMLQALLISVCLNNRAGLTCCSCTALPALAGSLDSAMLNTSLFSLGYCRCETSRIRLEDVQRQIKNVKCIIWLLWYLVWHRFVSLCSCWTTVPVKSLDTPTHSMVFLYFYYFLHCWITVKTSSYEVAHVESCSNQKSVKQIKIYFIFEILQSCHPWPSWQLCTLLAFSQPAFQLTSVPC